MNEQPTPVPPQPEVTPTPYAPLSQPEATQPAIDVPQTSQQFMQPPGAQDMLQWQASEYVMREKNQTWFLGLAGVALVMILLAIFLLKNWLFAVLIFVMAAAVFVFARRPARDMVYRLSPEMLMVNEKSFRLDEFRAFGVMREGGLYSVVLLPVKRFSPGVNIYFPPEHGEVIVDILGSRLPMEKIEPDFIDRLTDRLHF